MITDFVEQTENNRRSINLMLGFMGITQPDHLDVRAFYSGLRITSKDPLLTISVYEPRHVHQMETIDVDQYDEYSGATYELCDCGIELVENWDWNPITDEYTRTYRLVDTNDWTIQRRDS